VIGTESRGTARSAAAMPMPLAVEPDLERALDRAIAAIWRDLA